MRYSFNSHDAASFQHAMYRQFAEFFQQTVQMTTKKTNMERMQEISDLNDAYKIRAIALQKMWAQDWSQLLESAKSMNNFQDLPNYVSQYGKLLNQSEVQLTKQIEEYTELLENTVSSYSYWLAKQIQNDYLY